MGKNIIGGWRNYESRIYGILHILILLLSVFLIITISIDTFRNISFLNQGNYMEIQLWICSFFMFDFLLEFVFIIRKTKCSSVLKQNVLFYKTKRTSVNLFSYPNWHKKAPKKYVFFGAFYCSVFWLSHQKSLTLNKYIIFGFNAILIPLKRRYIIPPESWARHRLYSIMSVYVAL